MAGAGEMAPALRAARVGAGRVGVTGRRGARSQRGPTGSQRGAALGDATCPGLEDWPQAEAPLMAAPPALLSSCRWAQDGCWASTLAGPRGSRATEAHWTQHRGWQEGRFSLQPREALAPGPVSHSAQSLEGRRATPRQPHPSSLASA